jgi:hypothetical protein
VGFGKVEVKSGAGKKSCGGQKACVVDNKLVWLTTWILRHWPMRLRDCVAREMHVLLKASRAGRHWPGAAPLYLSVVQQDSCVASFTIHVYIMHLPKEIARASLSQP